MNNATTKTARLRLLAYEDDPAVALVVTEDTDEDALPIIPTAMASRYWTHPSSNPVPPGSSNGLYGHDRRLPTPVGSSGQPRRPPTPAGCVLLGLTHWRRLRKAQNT